MQLPHLRGGVQTVEEDVQVERILSDVDPGKYCLWGPREVNLGVGGRHASQHERVGRGRERGQIHTMTTFNVHCMFENVMVLYLIFSRGGAFHCIR